MEVVDTTRLTQSVILDTLIRTHFNIEEYN